MEDDDIFSEQGQARDPKDEEKLREENELMKMKIQAQFGGMSDSSDKLDPGIENEFLKQVIAFEEQFNRDYKPEKLSAFLGNPVFKKSEELDDEEFEKEASRLTELLESKGISVSFLRDRDDRFQYKFVTEGLFDHESDFGVSMPGLMTCFTYEEFHPDHEMDIENRTEEFMQAWFERKTEFAKYYFDDQFVLPDGKILTLDDLTIRLRNFFDSFTAFENSEYKILEVKFQLQESEEQQGLGHAEGLVKYDAILESGERKTFNGPFKLYMSLRYEWWSVFYFVMPGF